MPSFGVIDLNEFRGFVHTGLNTLMVLQSPRFRIMINHTDMELFSQKSTFTSTGGLSLHLSPTEHVFYLLKTRWKARKNPEKLQSRPAEHQAFNALSFILSKLIQSIK